MLRVGTELHEGHKTAGVVADNDFLLHLRQYIGHGFDVDAAAGDFGGEAVGLVESTEAGGFTFGAVDAVDFVAFGLLEQLLGDAAGARDFGVVLGAGLVDHFFHFLLRLVDLIEGGFDRLGRIDGLEDDLAHGDAHFVLVTEFLESGVDGAGEFGASDGQDFVNGAVADDFAHDGLGHEAEGVADVPDTEQVVVRITDAVLDGPFDVDDVEIASEHEGFVDEVSACVDGSFTAGVGGAKAEFFFELFLGGDFVDPVDSEREFEVQAGADLVGEFSEAEDDADAICPDLEEGGEDQYGDDNGGQAEADVAWVELDTGLVRKLCVAGARCDVDDVFFFHLV